MTSSTNNNNNNNTAIKTTTTLLSTGKEVDSFYFALMCRCSIHDIDVQWLDTQTHCEVEVEYNYAKTLGVEITMDTIPNQKEYDKTVVLVSEQILSAIKSDPFRVSPVYVMPRPNGYNVRYVGYSSPD